MFIFEYIYNNPISSMVYLGIFLLACFSCYFNYRRDKVLAVIEEKNRQLEENRDTIIELQRAMDSGMWTASYDEKGELLECSFSKEFREVFFLEDETVFPNSREAWIDRLHPDDRIVAFAELQKYFTNSNEEPYSAPYRFLNGHNEYCWIMVRGRTQFWPNGKIKRFIGFTMDLSDNYNTDFLTGNLSVSGFNAAVEHFLKDRYDRDCYSVVYFNIRNFKAVNELWGFSTGDSLLKEFSNKLKNSPLNPFFVGRNGDHFLALIKKHEYMADQLEELCDFAYNSNMGSFSVHVRSGIYSIQEEMLSVAKMVDRAKLAADSITNEYANSYAVYEEGIRDKYVSEAFATAELERAIQDKEFKVYYQPIVDCATGKIASAEALVRWQHPTKGRIKPSAFIPALESNGYISEVDHYVMEWVLSFYKRHLENKLPLVPISINISWMDFYDKELLEWALKVLKSHEFNENLIRIEITESSYSAVHTDVKEVLQRLKELKVNLLLDDFGAGISSIDIMQRYDFKILKLDMSLTQKLGENPRTANMLKAIIDTCHQVGVKVIAEGVETEAQVDFYRENSCDYIQGYYFYEPMPEEEFEKLLEEKQAQDALLDYTSEEEFIPRSYYKGHLYFPNAEMQQRANLATETVLKLIGENSGVGAVSGCYDDRLSICYFSNLTSELLGYTREEFLEVSQGSYLNVILPEDRDIYLRNQDMIRYYRALGKDNRIVQIKEIRADVKTKAGETQWIASVRKMDNITEDEIAMILDNREAVERDSFTGLLTKKAFFEKVNRIIAAAPESPYSLIIFDLDRLKEINDACGHLRGDEIILVLTKELKTSFRSGDLVGRFGGDEFMVFLRDTSDQQVVRSRIEAVQKKVADNNFLVKLNRPVTISAGACCSSGNKTTFGELFEKADQAMYEAKNSGRNIMKIVE